MPKISCVVILIFLVSSLNAQKKSVKGFNEIIDTKEIKAHLSFLASDEMRGRAVGSPEIEIAADYIKKQFKTYGVLPAPGTDDYFQDLNFYKLLPPAVATAQVKQQSFNFKENLLILKGDSINWSGNMIYVGYGSPEDLARNDVKGKMVLALAGSRDADNINKVYVASLEKYKTMQEAGASGLVELLVQPAPWPALVSFLAQSIWTVNTDTSIPHAWLRPSDVASLKFDEASDVPGSIRIEGKKKQIVPGKNVIGMINGTDDKLKDEYIIVSAHYDHIGMQSNANGEDSIFNGARDNAVGTVALIQTAKYLSKNPTKRSVILVALTGEEKGVLGSQYYTDHPVVPLNKHVLAINCDGVGYNDKTRLTSISLGRTNTDETITRAAKNFGLSVGGDPDPKENFYERSDQVSFATKGIPAIKLQPGLAQMDDEIRKYYHRQADEVSTLDMQYLTKFYKAFVYAVYLLGNESYKPAWNSGDKFEAASKKLYN